MAGGEDGGQYWGLRGRDCVYQRPTRACCRKHVQMGVVNAVGGDHVAAGARGGVYGGQRLGLAQAGVALKGLGAGRAQALTLATLLTFITVDVFITACTIPHTALCRIDPCRCHR